MNHTQIKTIEVCSISELQQQIEAIVADFNNALPWFRGQSDSSWGLVPSVHRINKPAIEATMAQLFRLKAPSCHINCPDHKDYPSWLPIMRHYGLPTRLLDWTESPLVACYFAVAFEKRSTSAAIWVMSPGQLNSSFGIGNIPFITEDQLQPIIIDAFSYPPKVTADKALAIMAPYSHIKMLTQLSHYTIHSSPAPMEKLIPNRNALAKLVIPIHAQDTKSA